MKRYNNQPGASGSESNGPRRSTIMYAAGALVVGALMAVMIAGGSPARPATATTTCSSRIVIVGLSSSERSPRLQTLAVDLITEAAISGAVCDQPVSAFGVSGGGVVFPLMVGDDLAGLAPEGPNPKVRLSRLDPEIHRVVRQLVSSRLRAAYESDDAPAVSSVAALYQVASEHVGSNTDLIMITDGVNHDGEIDLNRPLEVGEGSRIARTVAVPQIGNRSTTLIGLAQVDSKTPPPGPSWPSEVHAFNDRVCQRSGSQKCRLFSIASTAEALGA